MISGGVSLAVMMLAAATPSSHLLCEGESVSMAIIPGQDIYPNSAPLKMEYDLRPSEGVVFAGSPANAPLCSETCKPHFGTEGAYFIRSEPNADTLSWDQLVWIYDRHTKSLRSWYTFNRTSLIENTLTCREE